MGQPENNCCKVVVKCRRTFLKVGEGVVIWIQEVMYVLFLISIISYHLLNMVLALNVYANIFVYSTVQ